MFYKPFSALPLYFIATNDFLKNTIDTEPEATERMMRNIVGEHVTREVDYD